MYSVVDIEPIMFYWRKPRKQMYFLLLLMCLTVTAIVYLVSTYKNKRVCSESTSNKRLYKRLGQDDLISVRAKHFYQELRRTNLTVVPKVVYTLWDEGWANAPPLQSMCLRSMRRHNADFVINALNMSEAEELINRKTYYSDIAWHNATIQAKSDIVRVEILARHGGIWVDSTVYCNEPLSNWLTDDLLSVQFFAFEKNNGVPAEIAPWIASWFLVAAKHSYMITTWRNLIREAWAKTPSPIDAFGYFWVHRLFRNLVLSNSSFRALFNYMPFLNADLPHCFRPKCSLPHVYKLSAESCSEVRRSIFAKEYKSINP